MVTRTEVIQGLKSRDEFQNRDIAAVLDYIETVFATSDQAARDNALTRKSRTLDGVTNRDVEAIYDYAATLGTPLVTFQEFLQALPNIQKDNVSRRFVTKLLDLVDNSFTYDQMVLADMGVSAGVFYSLTDGTLDTPTDEGPSANAGLTNVGGGESLDPDPPWPGAIASLDLSHRYNDGTFALAAFGASETGTLEGWFRIDILAGTDHFIEGSGGSRLIFIATTSGADLRILVQAPAVPDPGAWVTVTAYAQGDRVRLISDAGARINECEVAGTSDVGEPAFPTDGSTVVDGTVTWRDLGVRSQFHNLDLTTTFDPVAGEWFYVALVRESSGDWICYVNGVSVGTLAVAADDTTPGSFGTPKIGAFTEDYAMQEFNIGDNGGAEDQLRGSWTKVANYTQALTAAQVLAHYDKGLALGFTP